MSRGQRHNQMALRTQTGRSTRTRRMRKLRATTQNRGRRGRVSRDTARGRSARLLFGTDWPKTPSSSHRHRPTPASGSDEEESGNGLWARLTKTVAPLHHRRRPLMPRHSGAKTSSTLQVQAQPRQPVTAMLPFHLLRYPYLRLLLPNSVSTYEHAVKEAYCLCVNSKFMFT